jgi:dihydrodipicolinate synthase/N-acetylneuraminate lyase
MTIFGGAGGRSFLYELRAGASGTMASCAHPQHFVAVWRAFDAGADGEAERAFFEVLPLLAFPETAAAYVHGQKLLLERLGIFERSDLRTPGGRMDDVSAAQWLRLAATLGALPG